MLRRPGRFEARRAAALRGRSRLCCAGAALALLAAVVPARGEVSPPRAMEAPAPAWPGGAPSPEDVLVPIELTVRADGTVEDARVETSVEPRLDAAALEAVRRWRFEPAVRDGRPVAAKIRVAVRFQGEEQRVAAPPSGGAPSPPGPAAASTPAPAPPAFASASAPPAPASAPAPTAAAREAAVRPAVEVVVAGARRPAPPVAAGDFRVHVGQLRDVPRGSAEQMLTLAPGFYLENHSGEGHPSAVFLRGFSAGEGQDIEFVADGVPLNEVSNAHGHGYADSLFLIPELVRELRIVEGPFDPRQGDFAVAGTVSYELGLEPRGVIAQAGYGSFNARELLLLWGPAGTPAGTFAGVHAEQDDGFGPNRAHAAARFLGQIELRRDETTRVFVAASGYVTRFDSAGVIRKADVEARALDCPKDDDSQFFCLYDPNQGGAVGRFGASLRREHRGESHADTEQLFATVRRLRIRENLTGYMTDVGAIGEPQRGDGTEQIYQAVTVGARGSTTRWLDWLSHRQEAEIGFFARYDDGETRQRRLRRASGVPYRVDFDNDLGIGNIAGYVAVRFRPWRPLVLRGGVRLDTFFFSVEDRNRPTSDRSGEREPSDIVEALGVALGPRLSADVTLAPGLSVVASYGAGSRSSDAQALSDGEFAPFARVHAAETGLVLERGRGGPTELSARALAFYTRVERDLVLDETRGRNVLAGASNRFGALATARLVSSAGVDTQASLTYAEAYLPPAGASWYELTAGPRMPYIPRWVARLDTSVRREIALAGERFQAGLALGASYVAPRPLPLEQLGRETLTVDAAGRLRWQMVEVGLEVTNALDRRNHAAEFNYASNFASPDAPVSRLAARHFAAAPPRQLLGTLRVYFDAPPEPEETKDATSP
ncbi:TonB family protein [Sorangium sp. So ce834]|uniref:TonB family protein n=1 Tax=Sorangium sp. So ce834 TaxID=3133321 RepID=UPI003F61A336